MEIQKKYFPSKLSDNDSNYFAQLEGVLASVDELCSVLIIRSKKSYFFRIATSHPRYNEALLNEILKFHNLFKIKLDLSKSMKTSGTITFRLRLENQR